MEIINFKTLSNILIYYPDGKLISHVLIQSHKLKSCLQFFTDFIIMQATGHQQVYFTIVMPRKHCIWIMVWRYQLVYSCVPTHKNNTTIQTCFECIKL